MLSMKNINDIYILSILKMYIYKNVKIFWNESSIIKDSLGAVILYLIY